MSYQYERRGILLSAETQAALTLAHATAAKRRAEELVRRGASPGQAALRAQESTTAVLAWFFFVAPAMGFSFFASMMTLFINPIGLLVWGPEALLCLVLSIRVLNFHNAPADRTLTYRFPTWAVVVAYVAWSFIVFLFLLVAIVTQEP